MSTHSLHAENHEVYFCTFTCYKWLPLFEITEGYFMVYNWFKILSAKGCLLLGYVIMPNHVHVLLYPTEGSLNKLVANGKRFMAYELIDILQKANKEDVLKVLASGVQYNEIKKGKKHQVFRLSFDARKCFNEKMLTQKLDYIHHNPVRGKYNLVDDFTDYQHSSAAFYELNTKNEYITHYKKVGF